MSTIRLPAISLHDLLLCDWGVDLPISGGFGKSRDEPIVIDASDPAFVAKTQLLVLRGLGHGRGVFWRCLKRQFLGGEWPGIEQFKIETVELTDTEVITQTENYYFDLSAMIAGGATSPIDAPCYCDNSGLCFPFKIGWLHFRGVEDNESNAPGLGITLRYGAPEIKGTVFVYDRERSDIPGDVTDPWVQAEFEQASADIATIRSDVTPWPHPTPSGAYLVRYFALGLDAREATVIWMTVACGKLVKARLTWTRDHFLDSVGNEFLRSLLVCLGKSN